MPRNMTHIKTKSANVLSHELGISIVLWKVSGLSLNKTTFHFSLNPFMCGILFSLGLKSFRKLESLLIFFFDNSLSSFSSYSAGRSQHHKAMILLFPINESIFLGFHNTFETESKFAFQFKLFLYIFAFFHLWCVYFTFLENRKIFFHFFLSSPGFWFNENEWKIRIFIIFCRLNRDVIFVKTDIKILILMLFVCLCGIFMVKKRFEDFLIKNKLNFRIWFLVWSHYEY